MTMVQYASLPAEVQRRLNLIEQTIVNLLNIVEQLLMAREIDEAEIPLVVAQRNRLNDVMAMVEKTAPQDAPIHVTIARTRETLKRIDAKMTGSIPMT
jgi:signal transduction histidine kinase